MKRKAIAYIIGVLFLTGCNTYSEKELLEFDQAIVDYINLKDLSFEKSESGFYYNITNIGDGDDYIQFNDEVTFYYKGSFLDGNTFQIVDQNEPISYQVNQLIVGWQEALMLIKEKGSIQIIIPPQLAYGDKKTGTIPKNSILIYELTVVSVN